MSDSLLDDGAQQDDVLRAIRERVAEVVRVLA